MKRFSEQLHKKAASIKLQAAEKRELRERVVSYMEYHPMPGKAVGETKTSTTPIESFITIPFSYFARFGIATAVMLLVIVPALAERAVPGDGLYAVKVRFNEEVRSTLALTQYEKIEWETERLNRRIAEARLLASEGRLTEEVEVEVAAAVKTHTENAKREIETLRGEDEEEATLATIALNTTLEVQATSLKDKQEEGDQDDTSTTILAAAVGEVAAQELSVNPGVPGYGRLMARVEENTTRIYELLSALNFDDATVDHEDVTRRLGDIDRTVEEAVLVREEDEEAARGILVDALQRTQKLIVFLAEIQTSQEFEVEDFVPVVLTEDEHDGLLEDYKKETRILINDIEVRRASSSDDSLNDKITVSLEELYGLQAVLASSTEQAQTQSAYESIRELADDTLNLLPEKPEDILIEGVVIEEDVPLLEPEPATTSEPVTEEVAE